MAIDNLNYYSSWLPAGQQTDKYSSQPWCLKSKNLDIFSSSKSVKATAWSEPTTEDADIVAQDSKWHLVLKSDWKVYEDWTVFIDPSTNFPAYDISYTGVNWTYAPATRWTVQDMSVKYEWDERKSFVVFTDRASFVYSKTKIIFNKSFTNVSNYLTYIDLATDGYYFEKVDNSSAQSAELTIRVKKGDLSEIPIRVFAKEYSGDESNISLEKVSIYRCANFYYDAKLDWITYSSLVDTEDFSFSWDITTAPWITLNIPTSSGNNGYLDIKLKFKWTPKEWGSGKWNYGELYIDMNWWPVSAHLMNIGDGTLSDWDSNYYYSYLPIRDRKLVDIWSYAYSSSYWMKWVTFQPLYKWTSYRQEMWRGNNKIIYDFGADMWWENDPAMDVIWMTVWNEQVYMIWNLDWDGYIIPCDLSWGRWTPFIAYGCTFRWVTNIDYLLYLVWEDRGISRLWVFNQQELVPVIWWNKENESKDIVWVDEQYRFDWKILNWRKNLILSTTDYRIFQYGQTYGGKGWAFINDLPWVIYSLKTVWNDLVVDFWYPTSRTIQTWEWGDVPVSISVPLKVYSEDGTTVLLNATLGGHNLTAGSIVTEFWATAGFTWLSFSLNWDKLDADYPIYVDDDPTVVLYAVPDYTYIRKSTIYQDDTPIKRYNTEWSATYPIVLGNHLLEKEESDLYASYILPNSSCKLEFWGMANHYHFWTFTSEDNATLSTSADYKLKWATGTYALKFIEKNWNQYTFRLEWDLPVQTTNEMKITDSEWVDVITYSDFNHFRKIWEITTDKYCEWEFRFHNLNNKLELPKSYSLQIMVKGKGTVNYTPELFSVDLVANQRERW